MNSITAHISTTMLASAETSTATWAVLMVLVGGTISGLIVLYRSLSGKVQHAEDKVQHAEDKADDSESKLADARHAEMKTLVGQVGDDVKVVGGRMDKIEGRVAKVEIGHAELHQQIKAIKGGGE